MIRLVLTMLAAPPGGALASRDATEALSIGRAPGNGWVLEDRTLPLPILSRWHCTLHPEVQGWRVEDASGNGTFLNDESAPIGKGMSRMLQPGDRLRLGDYVLQAYWTPPPSLQMVGQPSGAADHRPAPVFPQTAGPGGLPPDFGVWTEHEAELTPDHGSAMQDAWSPPPSMGMLPPDWDQPIEQAPKPVFAGHSGPGQMLPADWDQLAPEPRESAFGPEQELLPELPLPDPVATVEAVPARPATAPELSAITVFLRGAGLTGPPVAAMAANPEAAMLALGATFRALIGGVRAVLRSRSAIKREFRITQTLIQADGGNALKLAPSDDKAVEALICEIRPGRAAATAAEALRDVALHELAMLSAMRGAARRMLMSIAPERVQASAGPFSAMLPAARKARAYDAYVALHACTLQALDDDFDSTFGREFARAYERLIDDMQTTEPTPPSPRPSTESNPQQPSLFQKDPM